MLWLVVSSCSHIDIGMVFDILRHEHCFRMDVKIWKGHIDYI